MYFCKSQFIYIWFFSDLTGFNLLELIFWIEEKIKQYNDKQMELSISKQRTIT
jgi:hypothetical protein